jgi:hypothetical protein
MESDWKNFRKDFLERLGYENVAKPSMVKSSKSEDEAYISVLYKLNEKRVNNQPMPLCNSFSKMVSDLQKKIDVSSSIKKSYIYIYICEKTIV